MVGRYVKGLKFSISNELSMHQISRKEEAYKLALKVEEKQSRQYFQRNRGGRRGISSPSRGGLNYSKGESSQGENKLADAWQEPQTQQRGRGFQSRGYCSGRGWEIQIRPFTCFRCGEEGHKELECSNYKMQERNWGETPKMDLAQVEHEGTKPEVSQNVGQSLMIRRTMVILEKEKA